jgi:hypothetical protein
MEGMSWSRPDRQSAHSVPILGGAEVIHNGRNGPGAARIAKALIVCQCQGVRLAHNGENGVAGRGPKP